MLLSDGLKKDGGGIEEGGFGCFIGDRIDYSINVVEEEVSCFRVEWHISIVVSRRGARGCSRSDDGESSNGENKEEQESEHFEAISVLS